MTKISMVIPYNVYLYNVYKNGVILRGITPLCEIMEL